MSHYQNIHLSDPTLWATALHVKFITSKTDSEAITLSAFSSTKSWQNNLAPHSTLSPQIHPKIQPRNPILDEDLFSELSFVKYFVRFFDCAFYYQFVFCLYIGDA